MPRGGGDNLVFLPNKCCSKIFKKEVIEMEEVVLKYVLIPLVALIGIYVVGSTVYQLFGVPAIALFGAVGGVAFFAKFFKH